MDVACIILCYVSLSFVRVVMVLVFLRWMWIGSLRLLKSC